MLQANKTPRINVGDYILCCISAWVMTQSLITGSVFWFIIGYMLFVNYAVWRREYVIR